MYEQKRAERGLPDTLTEPIFAAHNAAHIDEVLAALANPDKFTMIQAAPAVRVGIAEDFGLPFGTLAPGKLAAALRRVGFDRVYDTNFAADLTITEEATERVQRVTAHLKGEKNPPPLPMFTSCCPAWVRYMELNHPHLTKHLSTCKSPQQMAGPVFKIYGAQINNVDPSKIFNITVMPCTAKQYECSRPEMNASGFRDIDVAMTTRELSWLIKSKGIDLATLPEEAFDQPLGEYTGAGAIFGVTGGVMEAALRTGYYYITGKELEDVDITPVRGTIPGLRTAEIPVGDITLKVGVFTDLRNIEPVIQSLEEGTLDLHFVEVMTCPQGCVTGGGQPKLVADIDAPEAYANRRAALFEHDKELPIRRSHQNPAIQALYKDFLGKPCGEKSHHLLHTHYKES
jgi:ferredoxin hydrogenase